jgi:hypothetical protein
MTRETLATTLRSYHTAQVIVNQFSAQLKKGQAYSGPSVASMSDEDMYLLSKITI